MNTLVHLSHQGAILAHAFAVALIMMGLGLEGMSAEQEVRFVRDARPMPGSP